MFDPDYQLYPPNTDYKLVSLVDFSRYLIGDYKGFHVVPEADIVSRYQYPWRFPREGYFH
jgi:hypothetical protein